MTHFLLCNSVQVPPIARRPTLRLMVSECMDGNELFGDSLLFVTVVTSRSRSRLQTGMLSCRLTLITMAVLL